MAELLLGLLIVVVFAFLIRRIINEKPEGNWDSPVLPEEEEQEQQAVTEEQADAETAANDDEGVGETVGTVDSGGTGL